MAEARTGLQVLLQARLAPSQRQAVLRLTAALLQISAPSWLLVSLLKNKLGRWVSQ